MPFKPGDVVAVFFPFRDREGGKQRNVVVLSTQAHQDRTGHLIGVGVFTDPPPSQHEAFQIDSVAAKLHGWIHPEDPTTVTIAGARKVDELKPAQRSKLLAFVRSNLAVP